MRDDGLTCGSFLGGGLAGRRATMKQIALVGLLYVIALVGIGCALTLVPVPKLSHGQSEGYVRSC